MKRNTWLLETARTLALAITSSVLMVSAYGDDTATVPVARKTTGEETKKTEIKKEQGEPTHETLAEIKVTGKNQGTALQTLCADNKGNILAVVALPRYGESPTKSKVNSEVQVFDKQGKAIRQFDVPFQAQSIACGQDGKIFVAGDAHLATFEADGKLIKDLELPHIKKVSSNTEQLKKDAEAQLKQQKQSFEQSVKQIKDMKTKLEAKKEEDRSARDKQMIKQYEQILQSYSESEKYYSKLTVESIMHDTLSRLRYINSVAVTDKDIFIVCGESKGWGYAVWRMNHQFEDAKQVISGLGGCCGQMDICCDGDNLIVAENTNKKFARYSRDGKSLGKWGKPGDKDVSCFGGCCNPMNVRVGSKGDVFTSESEGFVKRFSSTGEFIGVVGKVNISGGCKNVAIAASPDDEHVYFCDQPGSRIFILARKKNVVQK